MSLYLRGCGLIEEEKKKRNLFGLADNGSILCYCSRKKVYHTAFPVPIAPIPPMSLQVFFGKYNSHEGIQRGVKYHISFCGHGW